MQTNDFTTFVPLGTVNIAATTTSASAALPISSGDAYSGVRPQVRLAHTGTNPGFVAFGGSGVVATANDLPIFNGNPEIFTVPSGATHVAAIQATGTGTIYITSGYGGR